MQCEQCEHHSTRPFILLLFLPVPQGAVPSDKHELPGPQSALKGTITNISRALKYNEAQSETTTADNKFNKTWLQVLFWPSHV